MSGKRKNLEGLLGFVALLVVILDAKTALSGATLGVDLCLKAVVPSLFPFFVLSGLANRALCSKPIPIFRPIGIICGIPKGLEHLFLLGLFSGYPVGAQGIADAYKSNALTRTDAKRMLGFCNNAGPSFIFGMVAGLFSTPLIPLVLWSVHILSAVIVGILLPGKSKAGIQPVPYQKNHKNDVLAGGIKAIAVVCGWVIIFRVLIAFAGRWFLWMMPMETQILLSGLLELCNGVFAMNNYPIAGFCFVLCSALLGLGGVCVAMQTLSVTADLGSGMYFPGKVLQGCISLVAAIILQPILFDPSQVYTFSSLWIAVPLAIILAICLVLKQIKNNSGNLTINYV